MLILKLILLYQLIELVKNDSAEEPQQHVLPHNVSVDLTALSIVKSFQLRPTNHYLPEVHTHSSRSAGEIAKFRHEGNFYQPLVVAGQRVKRDMNHQLLRYFHQPPAIYSHQVVHPQSWTTTKPLHQHYRKRRFIDHEAIMPESIERKIDPLDDQMSDNKSGKISIAWKQGADDNKDRKKDTADAMNADAVVHDHQPTVDEMRYFHDIYMLLAGPHKRNLFGHIQHGPHLFEKRFESQNGGNRFKGKVLWADKTGGYGEHHWDLAQGKLS